MPKPDSSKSTRSLYLGLMSGTSLDGVDGVLVEFFVGGEFRVLAHRYHPFLPELQTDLLALCVSGPDELERAARVSISLSRDYAATVEHLLTCINIDPADIRALGCHGQTVRHRPEQGFSVQLVNGALLAELTGIDVVTDFRSRDLAAGGQGAPLVPAFHEAFFRDPVVPRIVLNLGGIANLTCLFPGEATRGYDTGPANILMDAWIQRHRGETYDADGRWAKQGQLKTDWLERLMRHSFFENLPPKSTGREDFNLEWLAEQCSDLSGAQAQDVQRTLLELTVWSVTQAIQSEVCGKSKVELYVCGGGARNTFLLQRLVDSLPRVSVATTEILGLPVQQVEAAAFAWLAWAQVNRKPGNLPQVTGARHPVLLGALYPA